MEFYFDGRDFRGAPPSGGLPDAVERAKQREAAKAAHEESLKQSQQLRESLEQAEARREAEAMTTTNATGMIDHTFVQLLQQIFARRPDGTICWTRTRDERSKYLDEHQRRKEHGLPTTPGLD